MPFYARDVNGAIIGSADKIFQAVGILNNYGTPSNWYITDNAENTVFKNNGMYWGFDGNVCKSPSKGTPKGYIDSGDASSPGPWCAKGDNFHVLAPTGIFYGHTAQNLKGNPQRTQIAGTDVEANTGTMAYVYAQRKSNYNKITAAFDLKGATAKDTDSIDASRAGSNKWLFIYRNAGGRFMEAGFKMISSPINLQGPTPFWQAYIAVQGVNTYAFFDSFNSIPYKLYQSKNPSTGVVTLSGTLTAAIAINSLGAVTVTFTMNGNSVSHAMSSISLTADAYLKNAWKGPTNQQADYLYCISDCYYMSNNDLKTNCFDLESGSYISNVKVTNADLINMNMGTCRPFLISAANTECTKTKLYPRMQVRCVSTTASYDIFNQKHSSTGL